MKTSIPLTHLAKGRAAKIVEIKNAGRCLLHKLDSIGIIPETPIRLVRKSPYILEIGNSQYAIGRGIASRIIVAINYD